jgi:hypothetical protein
MLRTLIIVCICCSLAGFDCTSAWSQSTGYLKIEPKKVPGKSQHEVIAYRPREGDLVFYDDRHVIWTLLFIWAGTGPPLHMGIVVKKDNGSLAVLEAGPDDTVRVALMDLDKRLRQFHHDFQGTITIRRCKKTLGKEQSKALTQFAQAQTNKRYAVGRLLLQGTSFRSRGPIREKLLGKTYLDRDSWICSELAVAAGTVVKLFDPTAVHANVTYPRDLVDNVRHDLSSGWHDAAVWMPHREKQDERR